MDKYKRRYIALSNRAHERYIKGYYNAAWRDTILAEHYLRLIKGK